MVASSEVERPYEESFQHRRDGGKLTSDAERHLLPEARDGAHHSRSNLAQCGENFLGIVVDIDLCPGEEAEVAPCALEYMGDGEERHGAVPIGKRESPGVETQSGAVIAVSQHDPFGVARGSRGIDKRGDIIVGEFGVRQLRKGRGTTLQEVGIVVCLGAITQRDGRVHRNDHAEGRALREDVDHVVELRLISDKNSLDGGVGDDISHLFAGRSGIHGNGSRSESESCEIDHEGLGAVLRIDGYLIAGGDVEPG